MTRDERQFVSETKLANNNYTGILMATTGYGKTRVVINCIKKLLVNFPNYSSNIVVPTLYLKQQWEDNLKKANITNFEVKVINSVTLHDITINSDIVIYDEIKLYIKGDIFSKIFELSRKCKHKIGLTPRLDTNDILNINSFLPIVDTVTREEARKNGWVANFLEINYTVDFSNTKDRSDYNWQSKLHDDNFAYFNNDYSTANFCRTMPGAISYIRKNNIKIREGYTEKDEAKNIATKANIWFSSMQKRKTIIDKNLDKIKLTATLCNLLHTEYNRKIITFGAFTESADMLKTMTYNAISYHSGLKGEFVKYSELSKLGLDNLIKETNKPNLFNADPEIKLSKDNYIKFCIKQFEQGIFKTLHTCKALDLGADIKDVDTCLVYARDSKKSRLEQIQGRGIRKEGNKTSLLINVVLKNTKDENWLNKAQSGEKGIITVDNIEDFKDVIADVI